MSFSVKVEESKFTRLGKKYFLLTSQGNDAWAGGHALTFDELVRVRDEIDDFLMGINKGDNND